MSSEMCLYSVVLLALAQAVNMHSSGSCVESEPVNVWRKEGKKVLLEPTGEAHVHSCVGQKWLKRVCTHVGDARMALLRRP